MLESRSLQLTNCPVVGWDEREATRLSIIVPVSHLFHLLITLFIVLCNINRLSLYTLHFRSKLVAAFTGPSNTIISICAFVRDNLRSPLLLICITTTSRPKPAYPLQWVSDPTSRLVRRRRRRPPSRWQRQVRRLLSSLVSHRRCPDTHQPLAPLVSATLHGHLALGPFTPTTTACHSKQTISETSSVT